MYLEVLKKDLCPTYRPREPHAIVQFNEEQEFLFDVLCTSVTLPEEQAIVRRYEHGKDAQGALQAIVNYYLAFEKDLLDDICTPRLIELPANVTFTGHLSTWVELVHQYNRNVLDPHDKMEDRDKKLYLQKFVEGSGLEEVKVCKAYEDYVQDIFSAAVQLDDQNRHLTNQCFPDAVDSEDTEKKSIDDGTSTKNKSPTVGPTTSTTAPPQGSHHSDSSSYDTPCRRTSPRYKVTREIVHPSNRETTHGHHDGIQTR